MPCVILHELRHCGKLRAVRTSSTDVVGKTHGF